MNQPIHCEYCGKFTSYDKGVTYFIPDTHFTREQSGIICKSCAELEGIPEPTVEFLP